MLTRRRCAAAAALGALALTGCGGGAAPSGPSTGDGGGRLQVVAAFYPLQFVTERVAGDRAEVSNLTAPGAEPHDLELSPRAVAGLGEADLVVYEGGFQPAVDDAVVTEGGDRGLDVAPVADLDLTYAGDGHEDEHGHEEGGEHADEADEEVTDPHFWLDPQRLAAVGRAVADRLSEVDPDGAAAYAAGADALEADLEALDAELEQGLASCADRDLVTSHEAFGYLAERYDLRQVGISGLSPDEEPDAGRLAEVSRFVQEDGVGTIYVETLVSPETAQVVADETGAATAVLDPLEGLTEESAGSDYLEVQRANLAVLRAGQSCP